MYSLLILSSYSYVFQVIMSESSDILECEICSENLLIDQPFAKIDDTAEQGMYHVECLEKWLNQSNNGLHTQNKITSYSIYHNNELIEQHKINGQDYIVNISELSYTENQDLLNNNNNAPNVENINRIEAHDDDCCCGCRCSKVIGTACCILLIVAIFIGGFKIFY